MEEEINRANYNDESIKSLKWNEHIRLRPGMYIGKLGDGASPDDGIYILIKEVIDNSIDEFSMGFGRNIDIDIDFETKKIRVRDYGRGIPLGKVVDCVSKINTGAKYDSLSFQKSVGMNGVGTKAVNALSSYFYVQSIRDKKSKDAEFSKGEVVKDNKIEISNLEDGTVIEFIPDGELFGNYFFIDEYIEKMIWYYAYLNKGLVITYNNKKYSSKNGLYDLLDNNIDSEIIYPIIHIKEDNFEFALTHSDKAYGEEYYSFVNGQNTSQGGTHQQAFREALTKVCREFYKKDYEPSDIRSGIICAISLRIQEPIFESQTKTKLGSINMEPNGKGQTVRNFIIDVVKRNLDNYLYKNSETAERLLQKIVQSEKERKDIASIKKIAKESAKKISLHNKKLRDCRIHYNTKDDRRLESTLFITEGDSASGSITKSRDVNTQAVFSLRGKPLNSYGETKELVYKNEEFNLLQSALNIEEDLENLRYNNIVIATDADVDGMHIRMLLMTFFLQFFPELVKAGHVYILQTPLFRVRNKQKTFYCYSDEEKQSAITKLGTNPEITRFKGLGEISPDEFRHFIGKDIRLDPVLLNKESGIKEVLAFFMGDNTPERQNYIIENLRYEEVI
ncbi:MAG: DNA topoisomerase IV subunit B [Bacteroidales bacterium]|nr:type IIA DNA topoisomerase subunit B [Bacteroidales bacterium]MDD2576884.1 DNA topoisomerase IV subunit B [Bacteroidales bacterium]MDD4738972.1 DNA topoisomerase IV subunit B [Bacteroidales bacterium]NCC17959.1 type IIA DNA topoisomerase subunit B [Bacteroidia bacterium]